MRIYTERTVHLLLLSKGVQVFATSVLVTFSGLAGSRLSPLDSLSTLPMTIMLVAMGASTVAASAVFSYLGRRVGFASGAFVGALGGLICAWGIIQESFLALCIGCALLGAYQASAQYYRFAAADAVGPEDKAHAVSAVMVGGVFGAILGPFISMWGQSWLAPNIFAGPFFALALVLALNAGALSTLRDLPVQPAPNLNRANVSSLLRDEAFLRAVCLGAGAHVAMLYVMTAAPLAIVACGHAPGIAAAGIQWHLVAMFAPALATGFLHRRFGLSSLLYAGSLGFVGSILFFATGTSTVNFIVGLILLGIAWNFIHFSGTMLLVTTIPKVNQVKAQTVNEFVVMSSGAIASGLAGVVFSGASWPILLASASGVIGLLIVIAAAAIRASHRSNKASPVVVETRP
jgi:hypothetical protein